LKGWRFPRPVQLQWLARDLFSCQIAWPSLACRNPSATIMRCSMSKSFAPTAPARDSSCGADLKGNAGRCSIRRSLGPSMLR